MVIGEPFLIFFVVLVISILSLVTVVGIEEVGLTVSRVLEVDDEAIGKLDTGTGISPDL